jgi:hypothetical protein
MLACILTTHTHPHTPSECERKRDREREREREEREREREREREHSLQFNLMDLRGGRRFPQPAGNQKQAGKQVTAGTYTILCAMIARPMAFSKMRL